MLCVPYYNIILHFVVCTADCIVLYSTVLYRNTLHCTVLYCTVLYCTVLYCTVLYCTVLYRNKLHCTVLYFTVLYYTVPLRQHSLFCGMNALFVSHCVLYCVCYTVCCWEGCWTEREVAEDMTGCQSERNGMSEREQRRKQREWKGRDR
jgi:hypothetical protein